MKAEWLQPIEIKVMGNIVAYLDLLLIEDSRINRKWILVENVFVKEGYRSRGFATELMALAESKAKSLDCNGIKLMSGMERKEAHGLYRKLGYIEGLSFSRWLK